MGIFGFLSSFFSNPALVGGTLAGSVPIVIHLLNRQRYRRVWWAAMHWLWAAMRKAHRRVQVEQLILLAIRTLILVLLALALARPALQAGLAALGAAPTLHRVIVLDNSYSMGHLVNNRPLFVRAKEDLAKSLVDKMTLGDTLDIVLANSEAEELPRAEASKRQDALRDLLAAPLSDAGSNIPKGVARACKILSESAHLRQEIVVLTDQTREAWFSRDKPRKLDPNEEAWVAKVFSNPRSRPKLLVCRLSGGDSRENLAAAALEVDEKVVTAGVETQFLATVVNCGVSPAQDVQLNFLVDGELASTGTLAQLAPGRSGSWPFRHTFSEPGSHFLSLSLPPDALLPDNTCSLAVEVEKEVRVLCVDGQQRLEPNASELDFFHQALSPSKAEEIKLGRMPLAPEVINDGAFSEAHLDDYRLIVLGNVRLVPKDKIAALEEWVKKHGGSLWIWLGENVETGLYNQELRNLLPVTLGETVGSGDPDSKERERLNDKDADHPAVRKLQEMKGLGQFETFKRFKLLPREGQGENAPRVVLRYENGDAAAVEARLGEGRVLVLGTTADLAWNNWAAKKFYMPLVTFLALDLIQPAHALRNRMVGESFVYHLRQEEINPVRQAGGLRLSDPAGDAVTMEVNLELARAVSAPARRAGIYKALLPGDLQRQVHFAANRSIEESDLDTVEEKDVRECFPETPEAKTERGRFFEAPVTQADVEFLPDDPAALSGALREQQSSREIWRWLIGAVLVLLVVESLLAWRFGNYNR